MSDILNQTKSKMTAAFEHLKVELKGIRTNRANPAILDSVSVDVWGSKMRIRDIASLTTPEMRMILITPFDPQNAGAIGKAIEKANLGFQPIVDGNAVRLVIPQMDEAMRKEMVKLCHKRKEEAKVSVRNVRRDSNELAKRQKADGSLAEDAQKRLEKKIQEMTDQFCKEIDEMAEKKEKEISTI